MSFSVLVASFNPGPPPVTGKEPPRYVGVFSKIDTYGGDAAPHMVLN